MRSESLKIGTVEIEVTFKPIKNLHLSVHPPEGRVTISSPEFYDLEKVKIYAATKLSWIKNEQQKLAGQARESKKEFIAHESHYFLGKRYLLKITEGKRSKVILHHSTIELCIPASYDSFQKERVLYNWYRKELRKVLEKLIVEYSGKMNFAIPESGIRKMKTKWGSCAIINQHLWFNIELAKKPMDCIEYIVVHEMVHLIERHHNKNFILLMDRYLPAWRVQKKILNEIAL